MKRWGHNVTTILPERMIHGYVDVLISASKRKAIEHTLARNREMRETVEAWRSQNANLRLLALLEELPPMSREMQGTVFRLEGRLRRRSSLEFLRVAAVITLLSAGVAGTLVLAQSQWSESGVLAGLADDAAHAHRVFSRQLSWGTAESAVEQPQYHPDSAQAAAGNVDVLTPDSTPGSNSQPKPQSDVPEEPPEITEPARDI